MSDSDFQDERDLFGELTRLPSGKRGRPAHRYAVEIANKIALGLALGWSQTRIANGVNISIPTMKQYYSSILKRREMQRDRLELWKFDKLQQLGVDGNVAALKEMDRMLVKNDMMSASARARSDQDDLPEETKEALGKKELAKRDATDLVDREDWLTPGFGPN